MGIVELPINILYLILTYFRGTYGASFTQNRTHWSEVSRTL